MSEPVILPNSLRRQLLEQALANPHREVCGLLGGCGQALLSYYPVRNIAADPANEFLMDPAGQIGVMKQLRASGEQLLGIFHTHPTTTARPSARDERLAYYPDTIYFILSLMTSPPDLRAYYFDGERFSERPIQTE